MGVQSKEETITTTIEVSKDVFLKFKAMCVLSEKTISGEVEDLMRKRAEQLNENGILTRVE